MAPSDWSSILQNRILAVTAIFALLLKLPDFLHYIPSLLDCLSRKRGSLEVEHNLRIARSRNLLSVIFLIPLCLVYDRFGIISYERVDAQWGSLAVLGTMIIYWILRLAAFALCQRTAGSRALRSDEAQAVRFGPLNYLILLSILLLAAAFVLNFCKIEGMPCKLTLLCISGAVYLISFLRTGQILALNCSALSTILYLCALEILPTSLLVAAAVVL